MPLKTKHLTVLKQRLSSTAGKVQVLQHPDEDIQVLCDQLVEELNLTLPFDMTFFHEPLLLALMVKSQALDQVVAPPGGGSP